jgi:hypothetical protein
MGSVHPDCVQGRKKVVLLVWQSYGQGHGQGGGEVGKCVSVNLQLQALVWQSYWQDHRDHGQGPFHGTWQDPRKFSQQVHVWGVHWVRRRV